MSDIEVLQSDIENIKNDIEEIKRTLDIKPKVKETRIILTVMFFLISGLILILTYYCLYKIDRRFDDIGTPVIMRGNQVYEVPEDAKIKFYPHDFKDTTKTTSK